MQPDNGRARVDAHPKAQPLAFRHVLAVRGDRALHRQRRAHGAQGVIGQIVRGVEDAHDLVAHELVERPILRQHRIRADREVLVEHLDRAAPGRAFRRTS